MFLLKTQIEFEAAHRLYNVNTYSKECRENVHGHSYKVEFEISRPELDDSGMVIDFKLLKNLLNLNITAVYDHSCILKSDDPLVKPIQDSCKKVVVVDENPTAEWMAFEFYKIMNRALAQFDILLDVRKVSVQETEHNIAVYIKEDE